MSNKKIAGKKIMKIAKGTARALRRVGKKKKEITVEDIKHPKHLTQILTDTEFTS